MNAAVKMKPAAGGIRQVPLAAIKLDKMAQPRAEIDHDLVGEYREAMAAGEQFPPLVVFNDRRTYWLADGFHRHEAARQAALREVACIVHDGGLRDAILYSCSANAVHGWRRSNGDKRRAVLTLLADEEWGTWSDREIARRAKVGTPFVGKLRAELQAEERAEQPSGLTVTDYSEKGAGERTYTTKHGTVSTMKTGRIGRRRQGNPELQRLIREMVEAGKNSSTAEQFREAGSAGEPVLDGAADRTETPSAGEGASTGSAREPVGAEGAAAELPGGRSLATLEALLASLCAIVTPADEIAAAVGEDLERRDALFGMCRTAERMLHGFGLALEALDA